MKLDTHTEYRRAVALEKKLSNARFALKDDWSLTRKLSDIPRKAGAHALGQLCIELNNAINEYEQRTFSFGKQGEDETG